MKTPLTLEEFRLIIKEYPTVPQAVCEELWDTIHRINTFGFVTISEEYARKIFDAYGKVRKKRQKRYIITYVPSSIIRMLRRLD